MHWSFVLLQNILLSLSLLFDLHYIWHDIIIWWCRCLEWNAIIFHTQHKKKNCMPVFFFWTSLRFVLKILFLKTQQCYHHHIIFDTLKNNSLICCYVIFMFLWKKYRKTTKKTQPCLVKRVPLYYNNTLDFSAYLF